MTFSYLKTILILLLVCSCCSTQKKSTVTDLETNKKECKQALQTLLTAIENRDLETLKSKLSPNGQLQLIMPATKVTNTVEAFVNLHREWFKDTTWTIETKITNMAVGNVIGTATTEQLYKEPLRNGKPYFNNMVVTYTLQKVDGNWYVIKDHACSIEKTKS